MSIIKVTVFSNSWIALCGGASVILTYLAYQQPIESIPVLLLFFATFSRYNIIAFTLPNTVTGEKFVFMKKHKPVLKASFFITSVLAAYFTYQLSIKQLLFLAHLGLLTLWYIFPLPLGFTQIKPLRKLPFLKIFLIAYVWAASTYIMPLIPNLKFTLNESLGFFERFLFLFAITLPFHIKGKVMK